MVQWEGEIGQTRLIKKSVNRINKSRTPKTRTLTQDFRSPTKRGIFMKFLELKCSKDVEKQNFRINLSKQTQIKANRSAREILKICQHILIPK